MKNAIQELAIIYTEQIALKSRKCILNNLWDIPSDLPKDVTIFKNLFSKSLSLIRTSKCTEEDKHIFFESVFKGELRILLHQIVEIKRLDIQKAEDVCQDILISLFKKLLPDSNEKSYGKGKKELSFSNDDYKSFVFYCLKVIKNYGSNQLNTKIQYKIEEFN